MIFRILALGRLPSLALAQAQPPSGGLKVLLVEAVNTDIVRWLILHCKKNKGFWCLTVGNLHTS